MLAVLFAILSAATFGLTNATARRGVVTGTVTQVVAVSMPIGLVLFAVVAAATGQIARVGEFSARELAMLSSAGVIHFLLGRYCGYRSMQAMGANLAGPVQQWSLLVTLTLAIAFLGESLNVLKLAGITCLVMGTMIVVRSQRRPARPTTSSAREPRGGASAAAAAATPRDAISSAPANPSASPAKEVFRPKLAEGYLFGILSCFFWGSSPVLVRAVVGGTDRALAGGVVSYGAATVAVAVILLWPPAMRDALAISRHNMVWAAWAGVLVCVSQMFHYLAMALAALTLVQPIMQFQVVFRTMFGWAINREHEVFSSGVLAAIAVSLLGALFLTLDTGFLLDAVESPWLRALLGWSWPAR